MNIIRILAAAAIFLAAVSQSFAWTHGSPPSGFNGGKAQINTSDVQFGGSYDFVNALLNAQAWSAGDNSGGVPADELDSNGYPLPGSNVMTLHGGVKTVFNQPSPADAGYVRALQTTGKCTVVVNGTILTTATQDSPLTISSIVGGNGSTVVNFSGATDFTVGMETVFASVSGTIAASLNGNVFVVSAVGANSITITTGNLSGLSGSAGNAAYGRNAIGVATGGRYIFKWSNPPPTESNGGVISGTLAIWSQDAVTPCTRIAVVPLGSEEARYNADPLAFSQKMLDVMASAKPGVVRNLNVVHGNLSNEVSWSQRKPTTYWSFASGNYIASLYQSTATGSGHDYTASGGSGTPTDKQQIITTFPSIGVTCNAGTSAELTFASTPPGVNDAIRIYYVFGSGTLPTDQATGQDLSVYNTTYYVKSVVGNKITFSASLNGSDVVFSSCGTATLKAHITEANSAASFSNGSTNVTWNNHPPLSVGDPIACGVQGSGAVPSNYDEYKLSYYVASVPSGNAITLAATSGGAAITWASASSGSVVCVRQPTFALPGGSAYPLRDKYFGRISIGGNSQPLASCYGNGFCQGVLTFDSGIGAWSLYGATDAAGDQAIANNWPPEVYLKYAKELHAHPWVVSPQYALDPVSDYMPSLIKMYKDGAPSWMIPRFEGINECWNLYFGPTGYTIAKSKSNWPSSTTNSYNVNAECAKMASTLGQAAQQIYGGGVVGNGYHMVQGVQTALGSTAANATGAYAERMDASLYVGQTPGTQQANLTGSWGTVTFALAPAYNFVTMFANAQYYFEAAYNTTQEATWAANVRIFNGSVTGTTMTVSSMAVGTRPLAAGDYLYGGFLNQNPTIAAQLTGTGGAGCPDATCDGTTGTYSITQNIGTLQTPSQRMAAIDQATASLYADTAGGLKATCTLASGTLTVSGIDYPLMAEIMSTLGPITVSGVGINFSTQITGMTGTGSGGNGTYPVSGTQNVGPVACYLSVLSVEAIANLSYNEYNFAQGYTNLAGNHPTMAGYEGGYSPDYGPSEQINRLRFFGKLPNATYTWSLRNQQNYVAVGGQFPSHFNFTGQQPSTNAWSALEDIYQTPNTPIWRAFKDFSTQ